MRRKDKGAGTVKPIEKKTQGESYQCMQAMQCVKKIVGLFSAMSSDKSKWA